MGNILDKRSTLDRIKQYYSLKGNAELARFLGVASNTITNWYGRNTFDIDLIYTKCVDMDFNWLLTGRGEVSPVVPDVQILHRPKCMEKNIHNQAIKLYDVAAAANLKTLFANKDQNILGEISIPDIPKCDGAIYVRGDSMYPILKSGDIIAYKEIGNFENVIFGEMYLVSFDLEGDDYLTVKYVNRSDQKGYIKLVSYNQHHDPKDIPVSSINAMGLIKFSIRKNTIM